MQCHYRLQDVKARKVWCRVLPEGCQPLVTSAVNRGASAGSRIFLTDLGGGLLQVEMVALQEEDAGEYGCVVEGFSGPQTVHRVTLDVLPAGELSQPGQQPWPAPLPQPAALGSLVGGALVGEEYWPNAQYSFDSSAGNGSQTG